MNLKHKNTKLEIEGILCHTVIGCFDFERTDKQDLDISLELDLGSIKANDELGNTVDYWQVCDVVRDFVENKSYLLLETLVDELADYLLDKYQLLKAIQVSVCKLSLSNKKSRYIKCHIYKQRQYKVALALGSNMHNPRQQLISAIELLGEFITEIKIAKIYKSSPFGFTEQEDFYNTCISGYTTLEPAKLLIALKKLEKQQGKQELFVNGPRVIDLDIVFFEDYNLTYGWLQIPHPAMHERDFVLLPLSDIEPDWVHPINKKTVKEMLAQTTVGKYIIQE